MKKYTSDICNKSLITKVSTFFRPWNWYFFLHRRWKSAEKCVPSFMPVSAIKLILDKFWLSYKFAKLVGVAKLYSCINGSEDIRLLQLKCGNWFEFAYQFERSSKPKLLIFNDFLQYFLTLAKKRIENQTC